MLIYPISGLLDEQPKATIQLPQNGWFHLAFTFEAVDGRTVIIPYVNGLPGDSFRVEGMTDFENQSGDAYIGQRPGQLEAQEHRYRGAFAGMSIHERVEYADQFSPPNPFWGWAEGSTSWYSQGMGIAHGPSGGRVYWATVLGGWFPLWLDHGFETISEAPWCVVGWQCGDGVKTEFEGCDDGNRDDGDGCSAACQDEA